MKHETDMKLRVGLTTQRTLRFDNIKPTSATIDAMLEDQDL
jgi:hypothetical protein